MAARGASILGPSLPFRYLRCRGAKSRQHPFPRVRGHSYLTETFPTSAPEWTRLNPAPDDYILPNFADKTRLTLYAGSGGHGCISFQREAYLPNGPANGGDGGHGGSIYIQAVHGETSLHKLARRRIMRADRGKSGQGSGQGGRRGEDVIITVPVGTVVREISREDHAAEEIAALKAARRRQRLALKAGEEATLDPQAEDMIRRKWILYPGISSSQAKEIELPRLPRRTRIFAQPEAPIHLDLSKPTPRPILLAVGGLGGLGNPHFVSTTTPRPLFATRGDPAITLKVELELKLLADVGLVGLPNAGKSTLLRAVTNSRARVGSWQFTTLVPNIGTVVLDNNRGRPLINSIRRNSHDESESAAGDSDTDVIARRRFTIADIPGLIEGAHLDKGLGMEFLRHVERAGVLAFVIDLSAGNAVKALKSLWNEVALYGQMTAEEDQERNRKAQIDWNGEGADDSSQRQPILNRTVEDYPMAPEESPSSHITGKPWFVVATKGDLPDTQENFQELRQYLTRVSDGDELHPSGIAGAWTANCAAIPVSAINGQGVDRVIHWAVGLLDS
jgi:GTPase